MCDKCCVSTFYKSWNHEEQFISWLSHTNPRNWFFPYLCALCYEELQKPNQYNKESTTSYLLLHAQRKAACHTCLPHSLGLTGDSLSFIRIGFRFQHGKLGNRVVSTSAQSLTSACLAAHLGCWEAQEVLHTVIQITLSRRVMSTQNWDRCAPEQQLKSSLSRWGRTLKCHLPGSFFPQEMWMLS